MSATALRGARVHPALDRLAARVAARPEVNTEVLILVACFYFSLCTNAMFWRAAVQDPGTQWRWAFSLLLIITAVHAVWCCMLVWRGTARWVLSAMILVSALSGHYMRAYGIYIDADMARNVLHTDWREASELLGADALLPLLCAMPALVVTWRVRLRSRPWRAALIARAGLFALALLMGAVGAALSTQQLTAFLRNHREVRYLVTPANVLVSLAKIVTEEPPGHARAQLPIGQDAVQLSRGTRRPRLLVLVVGETARAASWGLNGYVRPTTPELAALGVVNFPHVTACGSSTEVSLPCMFSPQGRAHYDESEIRSHQSLLHVLRNAGIDTLWRDNQSGCKGVCTGLAFEDLRTRNDPALCDGQRCHDGILISGLADLHGRRTRDQVIVLHMLGNHGPSYFERYPSTFRHYLPACETADLSRCSREQIANAYDNALRYTDHVLAGAITALRQRRDYDTALLYVSDHGESLGEKGLYLHGMPHAIAPREQLEVPMIAWFSEGWLRSAGMQEACLHARAESGRFSHDELFHSVLGLLDVATSLYRPDHDLFATCRPFSRSLP